MKIVEWDTNKKLKESTKICRPVDRKRIQRTSTETSEE